MYKLPLFVISLLALVILVGCAIRVPTAQPAPLPAVDAAPVDSGRTDLEGRWDGSISIMGTQLRIIVNFTRDGDGWVGTIDIPQQGASDIPLHSISFDSPRVHFEMLSGPQLAVLEGELQADGSIAGTFSQSGFTGTFQLLPVADPEIEAVAEEDLPYTAEEVTFSHGDVSLAGTLTLPEGDGPHPALILVTGSGPQNRDEEIYLAPGYRPFAVIADTLTRQGIAVLRYDDRGVGGSTGEVESATSADFAEDTESALNYLLDRDEIDPAQIGILGHSEGGMIATMLAARNPDIAFIILMAGPGLSGYDVVLEQAVLLAADGGASAEELESVRTRQTQVLDTVRNDEGWDELEVLIQDIIAEQLAQLPDAQKAQLGDLDAYAANVVAQQMAALQSPWYRFFIAYDPAEDLAQISVPVLAIFGGLDLQVPAEANADAVRAAAEAAGNEDVTIEIIPNANHLFQAAETGGVDEYSLLAPEFVPGFLELISEWLLARVELVQ
ncbi:MAG: alpha/beta fold hydrolase [Caldilineaceae bacterium]|nr:alpha/beta fold hydrolase [Caldilineaceae bacterium]